MNLSLDVLIGTRNTSFSNKLQALVESTAGLVNRCRTVNSYYDFRDAFDDVCPDVIICDLGCRVHMNDEIIRLRRIKPVYILISSENEGDYYRDAIVARAQGFYCPDYGLKVLTDLLKQVPIYQQNIRVFKRASLLLPETNGKLSVVTLNDILSIKGRSTQSIIYSDNIDFDGKIISLGIGEIYEKIRIDSGSIIRSHKSHLFNVNRVVGVERSYSRVYVGNRSLSVPISNMYRDNVKTRLEALS